VPELAAVPGRAAVQPAVEDDAAADAGGHREVDEAAQPAPGAVPVLGDGRGGGVVLEGERDAELGGGEGADRDVVPAGQVRGRLQQTRGRVERAPARDADCAHRAQPGLRDRLVAHREQPADDGLRALVAARGADAEPVHAPVWGDHGDGELGAADVEREDRRAGGRASARGRGRAVRRHASSRTPGGRAAGCGGARDPGRRAATMSRDPLGSIPE
jgi:hypothetical protein